MLLRHDPILETRPVHWHDEAGCAIWAQQLGHRISRERALQSAHIELHGPLGAGKTTFVRHLLRALGVAGRIKSPTYAVMEPHQAGEAEGGFAISHFDFYRFNDPREWADAGFRDVFAAPGLKLCEWPDKAAGMLPAPDLSLHIEPLDDGGRQVQAQAHTPLGQSLLA